MSNKVFIAKVRSLFEHALNVRSLIYIIYNTSPFNLPMTYVHIYTHKKTLEIHFVYSGKMEINCTFKTYCIISVTYSTKYHFFYTFYLYFLQYIFHKQCTEI